MAIALADHTTTFLVIWAALLAGVSLELWLPWTLSLGIANVVARVVVMQLHPNMLLEKWLISAVLVYHSIQMIMIFLVVAVFRPSSRPVASGLVLAEGICSFTILFGDSLIAFGSFRRKERLREQSRKWGDGKLPKPEVERFQFRDSQLEVTACTICLGDFTPEEEVGRLLPCGHEFHAQCLDKWLDLHKQMPWCPFRCRPSFAHGQVQQDGRNRADPLVIGAAEPEVDVEVMSV